MALERLQKIIAQAGLASRRAAERYIVEGRVRVNGKLIKELGAKADPETDTIDIVGIGVITKQPMAYVALHKPIHTVSTVKDPEKRMTVLDVIQKSRAVGRRAYEGELPRLFPVGRLDFDAEGLILLTNDGELSNKLLHPRHHVPKTYMVKVQGRVDESNLERLRRGVRLIETTGRLSRPTLPAEVSVAKLSKANTWLELTITEGRNHQVKRMLQAVGYNVLRLIRTDFGGISVDPLPAGAWRFLTKAEVHSLKRWAGLA